MGISGVKNDDVIDLSVRVSPDQHLTVVPFSGLPCVHHKGREDVFLPSPSGGHFLWNIREMLCGDAAQLRELS